MSALRAYCYLIALTTVIACSGSNAVSPDIDINVNLGDKPKAIKMNGVSLVGMPNQVGEECMKPIAAVNANWVVLTPYANGNEETGQVGWASEYQWWGEKEEGIRKCIELARAEKLQILLKPHLWVHGKFTGHLKFDNEEKWQTFESGFSEYMMAYAKLAEEQNVEAYCIGTEMKEFVLARPQFWKNFIKDVRKVYKGKITYAGNWDSYSLFPHWSMLDFIGINAYFPLSDAQTPEVDSLKAAWKHHENSIQNLQKSIGKRVLFTEFGYRSIDYSAKRPWESDRRSSVNMQAQANATQALLETFWPKDWFAGGFVWKWYERHDKVGGPDNNRFTPQNKPAEKILSEVYRQYSN